MSMVVIHISSLADELERIDPRTLIKSAPINAKYNLHSLGSVERKYNQKVHKRRYQRKVIAHAETF